MPDHCVSRNKDGGPCGAAVWRDGLCRWHHPELEAERIEERRRGGRDTARSHQRERRGGVRRRFDGHGSQISSSIRKSHISINLRHRNDAKARAVPNPPPF